MPTISIRKGKGSLTHNDRSIKNRSQEKSWNPKLSNQNIIYVNRKLEDVYSELFDQSQLKYNFEQKQKGHSERCVKSYLEKIKKSKQEKTNYELVVQIGNIADKNSTELKKIQKCLDEYNRTFQKRNPNFIVFQQITHRDEKGMDHTHINFVPISTGNKRGFETKNSFGGALSEMGYGRNGFEKWREHEQNALINIMREHGLEFELGSGRSEHLSIAEYQQVAQIAEKKATELLQNMENPVIDDIQPQIKTNPFTKKQTVTLEKADFDKINAKLRVQHNQIYTLELDKRSLSDKIENRDLKLAKLKNKPYTLENEALSQSVERLTEKNQGLESIIEKNLDEYNQLQTENTQLKQEKQSAISRVNDFKQQVQNLEPYKTEYSNAVKINHQLNENVKTLKLENEKLNEKLKTELDQLPKLEKTNQNLKTEIENLKVNLENEKSKTRKLSSEVDELKSQNQKLNKVIRDCVDQLKSVSQTLRFVLDYIENPFNEILDSIRWLNDNLLQRFRIEPKKLDKVIPYEVARNIELDVEYKHGELGEGIYLTDSEIMLNEFDSISEARDWYENADIENLCRSRDYDYER